MEINFYSKKYIRLLCIVIVLPFFISCQKDVKGTDPIIVPIPPIIPADLTTKVTASTISGFITDGNDIAVKDASVKIGTSTVLSDKYGYFEVRNMQVIQNAAVVTVTKTGFFKGIKTFIAATNKGAFFRIKLISKIISGTLNSASGGLVNIAGGLQINFPANAFIITSTSASYTGTVNVAAYKIDPTSADLPRIMPGDLRGLNTDSQLQLLTSYGMAAVELTGAGGELLQIAAGKNATMTMPIPATIIASAPATIPLWYFDETIGLWKQEGTATKTGTNYVGDVSHFSFWNYDVPNNYVQFNCKVVNTAGQTIQNAYVKISLVSNPNNAAFGYTDSTGYVSGAVPNNAQLKLEVFANASCGGAAAFSQNFSTTSVNVAFGNATINTTTSIANLTGIVKNCAGLPVTNGYVMIQDGYDNYRIALSDTGTYILNKILCSSPYQIKMIGEDIIGAQQSTPIAISLIAGKNTVSAIQACGLSTQLFVNYTINGVQYSYGFNKSDNIWSISGNTDYFVNAADSTYQNNIATSIRFSRIGIAVGSIQNLLHFTPLQISDSLSINPPIGINITEYGIVGQYISGNFTGVLIGLPPTNKVYNVSGNFRMRRLT